jgi:hypothetical protein
LKFLCALVNNAFLILIVPVVEPLLPIYGEFLGIMLYVNSEVDCVPRNAKPILQLRLDGLRLFFFRLFVLLLLFGLVIIMIAAVMAIMVLHTPKRVVEWVLIWNLKWHRIIHVNGYMWGSLNLRFGKELLVLHFLLLRFYFLLDCLKLPSDALDKIISGS